jgi:hypothetical protein
LALSAGEPPRQGEDQEAGRADGGDREDALAKVLDEAEAADWVVTEETSQETVVDPGSQQWQQAVRTEVEPERAAVGGDQDEKEAHLDATELEIGRCAVCGGLGWLPRARPP